MKHTNTEANRRSMNKDFATVIRYGHERGEVRSALDAAALLVSYCNRLLDTGEVSRELCDAALAEVQLNEVERGRLGLYLN